MTDLVEYEGILEDYVHSDEDGDAYDTVWNFVEDSLEPFGVTQETITEIVEAVDFEFIRDVNQDARIFEEDDNTEPSSANSEPSGDDIDAQVDDLFERD